MRVVARKVARRALVLRIVRPEGKTTNIEEWAKQHIVDDGASLAPAGDGPDGPEGNGTRLGSGRGPDAGLEELSATREVDSRRAKPNGGDEARNLEWCAIVCQRSRGRIEFHAVVIETGGAHRSVANSRALRAPSFGALRRRGAVRDAHDKLVWRLVASGWRPVDSGGAWYEAGFFRHRDAGVGIERSVITASREAGQARFVVETLDSYGNGRPCEVSATFEALRFFPLRPGEEAKAAHDELVARMESGGWVAVGSAQNEWYATSFERRRRHAGDPAPES